MVHAGSVAPILESRPVRVRSSWRTAEGVGAWAVTVEPLCPQAILAGPWACGGDPVTRQCQSMGADLSSLFNHRDPLASRSTAKKLRVQRTRDAALYNECPRRVPAASLVARGPCEASEQAGAARGPFAKRCHAAGSALVWSCTLPPSRTDAGVPASALDDLFCEEPCRAGHAACNPFL